MAGTTDPAERRSGRRAAAPARPRTGGLSGRRARERMVHLLFLVPALAYLGVFFGYPLGLNAYMAFTDYNTATFITGKANWIGLRNYTDVLASPLISTAFRNTILFTVVSVAGQLVIGMLIALFFQHRFPGRRWLSSLLLLPWLIPLVVVGTLWRWMLQQDGAVNGIAAGLGLPEHTGWLSSPSLALGTVIAVNIWIGLPFTFTIFSASLDGVPAELHEAASLDGAGYWRRFWHITLPAVRPVLSVLVILGVVFTLKVLDLVLIMTGGGPANSTQTLAMMAYTSSFKQFKFGQGAAIGNLLLLLTLVFAVVYVRLTRRSDQEASTL
ncbi:carbohydrate ABC transporter permease [Streptomyces sp.]|uniref:carbohydrate ABC transporter permease n=1 Tax=Streptomyces sp. TaxID=1931 RepID=UPI002F41CBFC